MRFEKIQPEKMNGNPFKMIGKDWFLLTAGDKDKLNTMTAGWGYMGVIWNKPSAVVLVRHSRYTYDLINNGDFFTISFYDDDFRPQLQLCGTKSGRDIDKTAAAGLTPAFADCGAPYFEEAHTVLVCKKRFEHELSEDDVPEEEKARFFPNGDYHRMYFAEIIEVLERR